MGNVGSLQWQHSLHSVHYYGMPTTQWLITEGMLQVQMHAHISWGESGNWLVSRITFAPWQTMRCRLALVDHVT